MPTDKHPLDEHTEISGSGPRRIRPTDRQMGLGTHNLIETAAKNKNNNKSK